MNKKIIVALIVGLVSVFAVFALVLGGTNFGITGYPKFSAIKPSKPYSYNGTVSKREYDNYRSSVVSYVEKAQEYLENADNDIKRIKEIQEDVIDDANSAIEEFNSWVKTITVSSSY